MAKTILIVNAVEWGQEHRGDNLPPVCSMDVGDWIRRAFGAGERKFLQWNVVQDPNPPLEEFDGVVISGSPASAYDPDPWIARLADAVRKWAERKIPTLGICFGHQLIAQSLGGKVEKNPLGWEVGTLEIELTAAGQTDPLFEGLPQKFKVMQSHRDIVTQLPPGAIALASSAMGDYHSMALGEYIRSVQFHPEYEPEMMRFIVQPRRARLEAAGVDVNRVIEGIAETPESGTLIRRFEERFVARTPVV